MNRCHVMFSEEENNFVFVFGSKLALESGALRNGYRLYYIGVFS